MILVTVSISIKPQRCFQALDRVVFATVAISEHNVVRAVLDFDMEEATFYSILLHCLVFFAFFVSWQLVGSGSKVLVIDWCGALPTCIKGVACLIPTDFSTHS